MPILNRTAVALVRPLKMAPNCCVSLGFGDAPSSLPNQPAGLFRSLPPLGGRSDQSWQLDEIVGGHGPDELEVELFDAAQHGPSQSTDRLAPAERLLDPLALLLADLVAGMAGGAAIMAERRPVVF